MDWAPTLKNCATHLQILNGICECGCCCMPHYSACHKLHDSCTVAADCPEGTVELNGECATTCPSSLEDLSYYQPGLASVDGLCTSSSTCTGQCHALCRVEAQANGRSLLFLINVHPISMGRTSCSASTDCPEGFACRIERGMDGYSTLCTAYVTPAAVAC